MKMLSTRRECARPHLNLAFCAAKELAVEMVSQSE
jgi:hypothetical protein